MNTPRHDSQVDERRQRLLAPCHSREWPNLMVARAENSFLWDLDDRRYIDFAAGIATMNTGHCHPKVTAAIGRQAAMFVHGAIGVTCWERALTLAEELGRITPGDIDMFNLNCSGTEAVEGAVKLCLAVSGRPAIIAFSGGFHGRTLGSCALTTTKASYRIGSQSFMGRVYHTPYAYCYRCPWGHSREGCSLECLAAVRRLFEHVVLPEEVAAIIVEPIQGIAGYITPPAAFLTGLREICTEHGILLIVDEVQAGFGRSGAMFASQKYGIEPDVITLGKAIASGVPLGAVGAPRRIMERWPVSGHGTTFGGSPLACAAALATIEVIEEERLPQRAEQLGDRAMTRLHRLRSRCPAVGDVRGLGLLIAVEFVDPEGSGQTPPPPAPQFTHRVQEICLDSGLLVYDGGTAGNVIRLMPPLTIPEGVLDEALDILEAAVERTAAEGVRG